MNKGIRKVVVLPLFALMLAGCGETEKPHEHAFGEWQVTKEATCTEDGEKTRTCECGEKETETIEATGHSFEEDWSTNDVGHWHAATCGHNDEKKDAGAHIWGEWQTTKQADCKTETNGERKQICEVCHKEKIEPVAYAHTYGEWEITKDETWKDAGSKKRTCSECTKVDTVEIPATNEGPEQSLTNLAVVAGIDSTWGTATAVENTKFGDGVKIVAGSEAGKDARLFSLVLDKTYDKAQTLADQDAYISFYLSCEGATTYADSNKPFQYQFVNGDTNSANRAASAPSDVAKLATVKTTSKATDRWIKITINFKDCTVDDGTPAEAFDRLNFRIKNSYLALAKDDYIVIASAYMHGGVEYVPVEHHYDTKWTSDNTHHWHACTDAECTSVSEKAAHTWVEDPDRDDVPATTEATGMEYRICSVCGKTKETVIPKIGEFVDIDKTINWKSNDDVAADNVVASDGTEALDGYKVFSYDKLTKDKQPIADYSMNVSSINFTDYTAVDLTLKSSNNAAFTISFYGKVDGADSHQIKSISLVSSEKGSSVSFDEKDTTLHLGKGKIKIKAGDTAVIRLMLANTAAISTRFIFQTTSSTNYEPPTTAGTLAISKVVTFKHIV